MALVKHKQKPIVRQMALAVAVRVPTLKDTLEELGIKAAMAVLLSGAVRTIMFALAVAVAVMAEAQKMEAMEQTMLAVAVVMAVTVKHG